MDSNEKRNNIPELPDRKLAQVSGGETFPFICKNCGKEFTDPDEYLNHINTHETSSDILE